MKLSASIKYIIGIDEAGRGPLAGPVAVGVCIVPAALTKKLLLKYAGIKKIKDSKKLSEKMREEWFAKMQEIGILFSVTLISNRVIDTKGISFAIRLAMSRSIKKLKPNRAVSLVLLDGGLRAPADFLKQKTIIKGDEKEFAISLASIAAKVTRDRHMVGLHKKYPAYNFKVHKGYGTKRHIAAIKKEGISPIHRRTFLKNIVSGA